MKKLKKTTVNSLFNSIQFNSIPKIVSIIALLFILLFLISCSSIEEPETEKPPHELAGKWNLPAYSWGRETGFVFNIDKDGNFSFNSSDDNSKEYHYYYTGKLADNFEYPYTIELVYNIYSSVLLSDMRQDIYNSYYKTLSPQQQVGKFTFIDASTCEAHFYMVYDWDYKWIENIFNDTNNWYSFRKR